MGLAWYQLVSNNCGTGAGGFKGGNSCSRGSKSGSGGGQIKKSSDDGTKDGRIVDRSKYAASESAIAEKATKKASKTGKGHDHLVAAVSHSNAARASFSAAHEKGVRKPQRDALMSKGRDHNLSAEKHASIAESKGVKRRGNALFSGSWSYHLPQ